MSHKIDSYVRAKMALNEAEAAIIGHVQATAWRWLQARKLTLGAHTGEEPSKATAMHLDDLDYEWLHVSWHETWSYGGEASGSYALPAKYLWDEAALAAFEAECAEKNKESVVAAEKQQRRHDLQQLAALKKKLNVA